MVGIGLGNYFLNFGEKGPLFYRGLLEGFGGSWQVKLGGLIFLLGKFQSQEPQGKEGGPPIKVAFKGFIGRKIFVKSFLKGGIRKKLDQLLTKGKLGFSQKDWDKRPG